MGRWTLDPEASVEATMAMHAPGAEKWAGSSGKAATLRRLERDVRARFTNLAFDLEVAQDGAPRVRRRDAGKEPRTPTRANFVPQGSRLRLVLGWPLRNGDDDPRPSDEPATREERWTAVVGGDRLRLRSDERGELLVLVRQSQSPASR